MSNSSISSTPDVNIVVDEKSLNELPRSRFWEVLDICQWEGFWFRSGNMLKQVMTFRSTFQARDDDVFLVSPMKTGTTWLKALSLCIMQNHQKRPDDYEDVLTTENPHFHVPTIEAISLATKSPEKDVYNSSVPRLQHTHMPYALLPDSIKNSPCKIVFITRNPKDTLISMWHFFNSLLRPNHDPYPLEKAVDCFCSGVHMYGPFFEQVLGFWQESLKRPEKILFLKFEDLKSDPKGQVMKMAEFLGRPFRDESEVDEVLWRCSLERLKNLEVNQSTASLFPRVPNSTYFRKGEVGDWQNYLTPEMEEQINQISRSKLEPIGLFL